MSERAILEALFISPISVLDQIVYILTKNHELKNIMYSFPFLSDKWNMKKFGKNKNMNEFGKSMPKISEIQAIETGFFVRFRLFFF
jgi:hypothetical protein